MFLVSHSTVTDSVEPVCCVFVELLLCICFEVTDWSVFSDTISRSAGFQPAWFPSSPDIVTSTLEDASTMLADLLLLR